MRIVLFAAPAALALTLSACASDMGPSRYQTEMEQLAADCAARGGVLSPTGQQSGRPQLDNVCKITGQPSDRIN
ncbi:hypothetical protein N0B44_17400 [Roseibacterium beibuensis]|uniref:hypothetical protein n=1 Tax=[Roseibacterium] beibuensis TaxID=1193142 RepID=UPI00217D16EA|nr:hypothetical protein [Roseibacterium beibuensis]MCS6624696.1 hypothetical protein [Roseibacterium beibuensis]